MSRYGRRVDRPSLTDDARSSRWARCVRRSRSTADSARFVVRFRYLVVVFWLAVAVVVSATLPSLSSEVNDNNSAFLAASAPSNKAADLATPLLGAGASGKISEITIIAFRDGGLTARRLRGDRPRGGAGATCQPGQVRQPARRSPPTDEAAQLRVRVQLSAGDITTDKAIVDALDATFPQARRPGRAAASPRRPGRDSDRQPGEQRQGGQQDPGVLVPVHHRAAAVRVPLAARPRS